jgi:Flp pilus assembly protein TadG
MSMKQWRDNLSDSNMGIRGKKCGMRRRQRGQAMIETAMVLPILMILLLGIIEVGRYAYLAIVVASSARAGAIYGAQNLVDAVNTAGIAAAAQNDANLGTYDSTTKTGLYVNTASELLPSSGPPSASFLSPCTTISDGDSPLPYVIVKTQYTAKSLFSSKTLTFNGCAQMQVAQ